MNVPWSRVHTFRLSPFALVFLSPPLHLPSLALGGAAFALAPHAGVRTPVGNLGQSLRPARLVLLVELAGSLRPATLIGLIGRNGTGKSSLLGIIAGTVVLDDGELRKGKPQGLSTKTLWRLPPLRTGTESRG